MAFLSLCRWDSEWLGLWAFSSTAVGGSPPCKNPVPDTLSHTQRCPGTSQASTVRAPGGLCTWKAVKHSKGCWADKLKARCAQCAGVHQEVTSRRRQGLWPDCGFREAHIQTRVSFLDREWSGSACLFPLPPPQPPTKPLPLCTQVTNKFWAGTKGMEDVGKHLDHGRCFGMLITWIGRTPAGKALPTGTHSEGTCCSLKLCSTVLLGGLGSEPFPRVPVSWSDGYRATAGKGMGLAFQTLTLIKM